VLEEDQELHGLSQAEAASGWLPGLLRAIEREGVQPRDARVRSLWELLRRRGLLRRSPWLRALLVRVWRQGLTTRPRPRTARRLARLLQLWGLLPRHDGRPTTLTRTRPLRRLRPVTLRPAPTVRVPPMSRPRFRPVGPRMSRR
jgi:hypothetical protein